MVLEPTSTRQAIPQSYCDRPRSTVLLYEPGRGLSHWCPQAGGAAPAHWHAARIVHHSGWRRGRSSAPLDRCIPRMHRATDRSRWPSRKN
eukprot:scaffold125375_cov32-Tisochrysis_lutea.AAC.1